MKQIANAWKEFFKQFAPYAFAENEIIADETGQQINDPNNVLYPRITYSYKVGNFLKDDIITFQVWDWAHGNDILLSVCDKIAAAVPVEIGTRITIPGETYLEYRHPDTGQWIRFGIEEFNSIAQWHADRKPPVIVDWHRVEKESVGELTVWRGSPFLTPSPKDEPLSRAMYGTLQARYRTIV